MSVQKDQSGRRWVQAEVVVPGTPEEVWAAIATSEGVSSWFVPTEVRDDGTVVSHFGPGMDAVAKETAWDPPRRFAAEGEMAPGGPKLATEWIVEARDGGTCLVRVVHSLFASTDDWDDQLGAIEAGWPDYFEILKLYLKHFRGQPCSAFQLMGMACEASDTVWKKIADSLGLLEAEVGELRTSPNNELEFAGIIERGESAGHAHQLLIQLKSPAPGIAHLFVMPMGPQVIVSMRFYLYGKTAAKNVELREPVWREWMNSHFPMPQPPDCSAETQQAKIEARAVHRFSISAEQVYDAWLEPSRVRQWMANALKEFGLSGEMRRVEIDPRVGGRFCFSDMRNGEEAVHHGEYLELVRPKRIVFTWMVGDEVVSDDNAELPSRVTVIIEPDGTGCVATIVHEMDAQWAEFVSRTEQGWARMLRAIDDLLK